VELIGSSADDQFATALAAVVYPGATGAGGNVTVETGRLILLDGSEILADTYGKGAGGSITLETRQLILQDGSEISADTYGKGAGGSITLETRQLILRDGSKILADTYGEGTGGTLEVSASESVELIGNALPADGEEYFSGLFTDAGATGNGGNLSISTGKLIAREGAQVSSTTSGVGSAGNLTIQATDVELVGSTRSADDGALLTGLFAGTYIGSGGDGGTLTVETERLHLRDGAVVQTSTLGAGDAGRLIVQASESVELIGRSANGQLPTGLYAFSGGFLGFPGFDEATGRGGELKIKTGELIVQDGAVVTVSSFSRDINKGAGSLQVQAQNISLDNQATVTAETKLGQGGNIILEVQDLLLLRRNSNISTFAGIPGAGGTGGNFSIDARFIVAVPSENSDIKTNAFTGQGGNINIRASGIFGAQFREQLTQESDIVASGEVEIYILDADPSQGLVSLPAELVNASNQIASSCAAVGKNKFIVTGRGGLPPNPSEPLNSDTVWSDLRTFTKLALTRSSSEEAANPTNSAPTQIVEAQGWMINDKGSLVLTATAPK
jgi:large exoprotein involved in heme utilization and adhesion